jgi:hypothetical protein
LRHNRVTQAANGREIDRDFSMPNATFLDDEPAMRESLSSMELSSAAQEVGIT